MPKYGIKTSEGPCRLVTSDEILYKLTLSQKIFQAKDLKVFVNQETDNDEMHHFVWFLLKIKIK